MGCCYNIEANKDYATMLVKANTLNKKRMKDTIESCKNDVSIIDYELTNNSCLASKSNVSIDKSNPNRNQYKLRVNNINQSTIEDNFKLKMNGSMLNSSKTNFDKNQSDDGIGTKSCFNLKSLIQLSHKRQYSHNNAANLKEISHFEIKRSEPNHGVIIPRLAKSHVSLNDNIKLPSKDCSPYKIKLEKYAFLFDDSPSKRKM